MGTFPITTWWVHFPSQHDGYISRHNTMGTFPVTTWWVHFPSQHDGHISRHNMMGTFPVTTWWVHFPMGTFPISGLIVTPLLVCVSSLSNGHWQLQAFFTQLSFVLVKIYSSDNQSLIDLCQEHNLVKWISLDLHWIAKMTRHQTIRWHWRCQGITP